ncbi:MAG: biotin--[acetyl-CoA-carboxylase] ligase [Melioribacteraceae bacterium]|nr:biotin--[acetyl-CoA-carboxylase] ligase [Melioribacteraceae bacterium]
MFNIEDFDIKLDTEFIGRNFIYSDEVSSTNRLLLDTEEYSKHGAVLLAEYQSQGKGRKDRVWLSNSGQNLTFSILLKEKLKENYVNFINLGASLAVAQSIENLYQLKVELKWPNDVLINKKKVAGILLESVSRGNKIERLVIGIGINVNQPSFQTKFEIPPTSIRLEFNELISRERLLSDILNNFEHILTMLYHSTDKILSDWKSRCKMIGEKIKIIEGEQAKYGVLEDIDEKGFLVLRQGDKTELIHYGDVTLR